MKKVFTLLLVFFVLRLSAQDRKLNLMAVYSMAANRIDRFTGIEKGYITVTLRQNGTYTIREITGTFSADKVLQGVYKVEGDKLTFNADDGTTSVYTLVKLDDLVVKLTAGQKTMYFVASRE